MNFDQWLVSHGQSIWITLVCLTMPVGAVVARFLASLLTRRRNSALAKALQVSVVDAPDLAHAGGFVGIEGILLADTRGPVATTTSCFAWDPRGTSSRVGGVRLAAGEETIELCGPIAVCAGSRQSRGQPVKGEHGPEATMERSVAAGDRVLVFGRLEQVPAAEFSGYRQAANRWRLRAEQAGDTMGVYFTGRPRVRWWPSGLAGALVAGALSLMVLMGVGHTLVTADRYTVQCHTWSITTPRASALASATPVYRDWGVRRYAMYRDLECAVVRERFIPECVPCDYEKRCECEFPPISSE